MNQTPRMYMIDATEDVRHKALGFRRPMVDITLMIGTLKLPAFLAESISCSRSLECSSKIKKSCLFSTRTSKSLPSLEVRIHMTCYLTMFLWVSLFRAAASLKAFTGIPCSFLGKTILLMAKLLLLLELMVWKTDP